MCTPVRFFFKVTKHERLRITFYLVIFGKPKSRAHPRGCLHYYKSQFCKEENTEAIVEETSRKRKRNAGLESTVYYGYYMGA